jgi:sulfoxide reductase catalytic subunit YedY
MLIGKAPDIRYSEITPKSLYVGRRGFIQAATVAAMGTAASLVPGAIESAAAQAAAQGPPPLTPAAGKLAKLANVKRSSLSTTEKITGYTDVTTYNNFYEFGTDKEDPSALSKNFKPRPWKISIEGHVAKPGEFDVDELIKAHTLEERIYRLRCVEIWSAVVPWIGIPMAEIIKQVQPTAMAKYVEFVTVFDPTQLPGQRRAVLQWPYIEALRLDEAMNPLTLLAVGMYGEVLPNQDGAPIRLVTPWKYGFKSGKSLAKIRFVDTQPRTAWQISAPQEYGFYANVNPTVDHPRWSQARERRLGEFLPRRTQMFNGYTEQVGSLYTGMDLKRNF